MPRPSKRKQQSRRASQRGFEESESEEDTSIVVDVSSDDSEAECEVFLTPEHTLHKLCAFDVLLNASTLSSCFQRVRSMCRESAKVGARNTAIMLREGNTNCNFAIIERLQLSSVLRLQRWWTHQSLTLMRRSMLFVSIGGQHMLNLISILVCFLILEWKLRLEEMLQRQHV